MTALQLTTSYTSKTNSVTTDTAFLKITRFDGNENNFNFYVSIWISEIAYNNVQKPFETLNFSVPTANISNIIDAYHYLQTLPAFTESHLVS